jgi:hypothetical protein
MLEKAQYRAAEAGWPRFEAVMRGLCEHRGEHFGNARVVRNLFDQVQQEQANRLSCIAEPTREELLTIDAVIVLAALLHDAVGDHRGSA